MSYKQVLENIVKRRKEQLALAADAFSYAIKHNDRLYAVEVELRELWLLEIKTGKTDDDKKKCLEEEKAKILADLGLTDKLLNPPPLCKKCKDTGLVNGKFCDCVKREAILKDDNISLPVRRFCDCDEAIQQQNGLKELYDHMRVFVKKFPATNIKNILLLGSTGTGKTHLASVIAGEVLDKGYSVVFLTAFGALRKMLAYHKSFDAERDDNLRPLLDCDLLIIDDLGTESILKNVTIEYLYIVINERTIKGLHTIITTNLSMSDLSERYGTKLVSRLFEKNTCLSRVLDGKDLRKITMQ